MVNGVKEFHLTAEPVQIAFGMQGFFIIHPRDASVRLVDRDFAIR